MFDGLRILKTTGRQDHPNFHNPELVREKFKPHPLARSLMQFEERLGKGTLKRRADVEEPLINASHSHLMWRVDRGLAFDASAAVSDDTVTNETNIFYSNFYPDLSCVFMTAELVDSQPAAYRGSSTTTDLLTLMHNRTGHEI